ncbi:hypothetical protein [Polynucleobacter sp. MG-27-Goln-C1]|uniref:hypothetical protein n=1 Tax=Polynucleobacter sp. MG-27-Goln-C1 TaxID=1819726 RepID=UPI001C0D4709|nr:hypothetical protein [Polynucleobacter sp. MG-27-Goln-C1]MBU3612857.1 hypothetical protein [Polynucleobacter sp. MG-27-Goln-C1]
MRKKLAEKMKFVHKINQHLNILVFGFFSIIFICITYLRVNTPISMMGDTGLLYSLLESIHNGNGQYTQIFASISDLIFTSNLPSAPLEKVCEMGVSSFSYTEEQMDFFKYHTYYILYPISLLVYLFKTPYVVQGLNILAFFSLLFISFFILSRLTQSRLIALLGISCVALHPAWSQSIIGQPYIDRLFLPVGLLIYYFAENNKLKSLLFSILVGCLINEKCILYIAVFLVAHSVLFFKKDFLRYRIFEFILGLLLLLLFYIITKLVINNAYYSSAIPKDISSLIMYFNDERFLNGSISLILISFIFIVVPLFKNFRYALISIIMLLPNIIGNIGGAEKTGFSTHYHSLYFPFLVYGFLVGFASIKKFSMSIINTFILYLFIFINIAIFYSTYNINSDQILSVKLKYNNLTLYSSLKNLIISRQSNAHIQKILFENIPKNANISSIEAGMPYLFKYQNVNYYPLNIGKSDFLVVKFNPHSQPKLIEGYSSYQGETHQKSANICLTQSIIKQNFDLDNPVFFSNSGLALIKKIPSN